jgi:hypothetical protein
MVEPTREPTVKYLQILIKNCAHGNEPQQHRGKITECRQAADRQLQSPSDVGKPSCAELPRRTAFACTLLVTRANSQVRSSVE